MRLNQILNNALALIPRNHSLEQRTVIIPADDVVVVEAWRLELTLE